ncbi:MAG: deoxyribonuclease V [Deltaproteobacteria bacterium]|nr:deoxyribonuclease V [Deltaproteobacteria bacterium]
MKIHHLHRFDVNYREAVQIQENLRDKLIICDRHIPRRPAIIAGADISYGKESDLFFAAVVLLSYPSLEVIEEAYAGERSSFPYIPGLLSFREGPPLLKAFAKLRRVPDIAIFDGQGIAHPRGIGLASHMGLFLDIPSIGCAKTRLCGSYNPVGERVGSYADLVGDDLVIGAVVRTKERVKPVFVSPGHKIGLKRAVDMALSCCAGYKLPEPIRQAHLAVNRFRREQSLIDS